MVLYRLSQIEKKVDLVIDDHEARLRKAEEALTRLQERLTTTTYVLGAISVVLSSIAAWLGALSK